MTDHSSDLSDELGLSFEERLLLEMASVAYTPAPGDLLGQLTRGYARALGSPLAARHSFYPAVESLVSRGFFSRKYEMLVCRPDVVEDVTAHMALQGRLQLAQEQLGKRASAWREDRWGATMRELRLALYSDGSQVQSTLLQLQKIAPKRDPWEPLARGLTRAQSYEAVPREYQQPILSFALNEAARRLTDPAGALAFLEQKAHQGELSDPVLRLALGQQWILRGQLERARQLPPELPALRAWLAFLEGRYEQAQADFELARSDPGSLGMQGLLYVLCLVRSREWDEARAFLALPGPQRPLAAQLSWLIEARSAGSTPPPPPTADPQPLNVLLAGLLGCWETRPVPPEPLARLALQAEQSGYLGLQAEVQAVLARLQGQAATSALLDCLPRGERWRRTVQALLDLSRATPAQPSSDERLVWCLSCPNEFWRAEPRVQKLGKRGDWSQGRSLTYGTLPQCATPADRQALHSLWKGQSKDKLWSLLVGHPLVFWEHPDFPIEVASGTPELQITHTPEGVRLSLQPASGAGIVREDLSLVRVYSCDETHRKMATLIGPGGVTLPADAAEVVQELVAGLAPLVRIVTDIGADRSVEEREADPGLVMRLRPWQSGLEVRALVQPLGPGGPEFLPGRGGRVALATLDGRPLQAARATTEERSRLQACLELCPTLAELDVGEGRWHLAELEPSLAVVEELAEVPRDLVRLEWPEGESLRVSRPRSVQLTVEGEGDWFAVSGDLITEEGQVLAMGELLEILRSGTRFVPLGDGKFLAIARELRRRLQELDNLVETGRDGSMRVHPLAAPSLATFPQLQADESFRRQLERLGESEQLQFSPPATFHAELRAYQREGFEWLAQRAHWGVGACLADDMGLGKTIQALALVVLRSPEGPTLVVAPTSVCHNWVEEAARFAPTLNLHVLAESDRQELLERVGPFDVVVCSYGLLTRECELLAQPLWRTLILDEAQAIKNHTTRRFAACMKLRAEFRLATTGTPVENRLEELWTLFRFLNPGLLGSEQRFRTRFVNPIEEGDLSIPLLLKRLVRPFLLRRTKSQVLRELPPRTDIVLEVELNAEERGLYEAIRQRAVSQLSEEEAQPLAVLAELTRLRRACCHPRLVLGAQAAAGGSKLEVLWELLEEMQAGGHRALVFSQFVDHLQIVRESLESAGLAYQYLDGSTPAPERVRRIAAFQAGEGAVFLISLRAGGVGLNLTAADYVVHLDPWWNPAVEDQASDRAHRIGQLRPVTVYRLVARGTVEEKILALHRHKRELAEGLLDGAATAVRLSADELLRLMRD